MITSPCWEGLACNVAVLSLAKAPPNRAGLDATPRRRAYRNRSAQPPAASRLRGLDAPHAEGRIETLYYPPFRQGRGSACSTQPHAEGRIETSSGRCAGRHCPGSAQPHAEGRTEN